MGFGNNVIYNNRYKVGVTYYVFIFMIIIYIFFYRYILLTIVLGN